MCTFRRAHWVTFPRECIYNGYYIELAEKRARVQRDSRLKAIARQRRWTRFFVGRFPLSLYPSLFLLPFPPSALAYLPLSPNVLLRDTQHGILPMYYAMWRLCTCLPAPRRNDPSVDFDSCLSSDSSIHRSVYTVCFINFSRDARCDLHDDLWYTGILYLLVPQKYWFFF